MKRIALLIASVFAASNRQPYDESRSRLCPTMNTPLRNCTAEQYTVTFAPPFFASDACTRLGLNLARISLANGDLASRALRRCLVPWAIVSPTAKNQDDYGVNDSSGNNDGGVTVLTNDGVLVMNAERDYCGKNVRVAILCEQVTRTTFASSTTISSSTSQTTTNNGAICQPTCGISGNFTLGLKGSYQNATCPIGYELAMVNITNIQQASTILANCTNSSSSSNANSGVDAVGPRAAWVGGWNQDEYRNQTCLVLTLGSASSGIGTIVPAINCTTQYQPLCQKQQNTTTSNCDNGAWRLVKQKVGYAVAEDACRCFTGYELATVDKPSAQVAQLYDQCFNSTDTDSMDDDDTIVWIRNAKNIGKCAAAVMLPGVSGLFYPSYGLTDQACRVKAYPLCKRKVAPVPCPRSSSESAKMSLPTPCISASSSESLSTPCISESETEKISTLSSCASSETAMPLVTESSQESITSTSCDEYMSRRGPKTSYDGDDDSEDDGGYESDDNN